MPVLACAAHGGWTARRGRGNLRGMDAGWSLRVRADGTIVVEVRPGADVRGAASALVQAAGSPRLGADRAVDSHVARALDAVARAPARRWTLSALARAAGLSRAPFARRFVRAMGVSPLRHVAIVRMRIAAERLVATDDALARIAASVGYVSEFAFSRAFKRHFGEAPGTFRKRQWAQTTALASMRAAA